MYLLARFKRMNGHPGIYTALIKKQKTKIMLICQDNTAKERVICYMKFKFLTITFYHCLKIW